MRDWPVEFRFVERTEAVSDDIARTVKILQVRYRDDNTGMYYADKDNRYTQWEDVPTVQERNGW